MSLIVGSLSSTSSGPKPNVSSRTSSMRRSRSMRLSSGFSVSHSRSTTRRISRRRVSPARSLTRDRSSLSTSLAWMMRLSSSRLLPLRSALVWLTLPMRLPLMLPVLMPLRPLCRRDMVRYLGCGLRGRLIDRFALPRLPKREEAAPLLLRGGGLAAQRLGQAGDARLRPTLGGVRQQRHAGVARADHRLVVVGDLPEDRLADRLGGLLQADLAVVAADPVEHDLDLRAQALLLV